MSTKRARRSFFIDNDFRRQNVRFDFGLQNFNNTVLDTVLDSRKSRLPARRLEP